MELFRVGGDVPETCYLFMGRCDNITGVTDKDYRADMLKATLWIEASTP